MISVVVTSILDVLLDLHDTFDSTDHRKCKRAYATAWKSRDPEDPESSDVLREAFKAEHVTRAYTDPDGPIVSPWLAAWRDGLDPRTADRRVRAARG